MSSSDKTQPGFRPRPAGGYQMATVELAAIDLREVSDQMLDLVDATRAGAAPAELGAVMASHLRRAGNELLRAAGALEGPAQRPTPPSGQATNSGPVSPGR